MKIDVFECNLDDGNESLFPCSALCHSLRLRRPTEKIDVSARLVTITGAEIPYLMGEEGRCGV